MAEPRVIEVPLPENAHPAPGDLDLLRVTCQALVSMRCESSREWERVVQRLEAQGWSVRCGLAWHVEARRGRELEEACGMTRDEAFSRLDQTAHVASVEGCP